STASLRLSKREHHSRTRRHRCRHDLHAEKAHVVVEVMSLGEIQHPAENAIEHRVEMAGAAVTQVFHQAVFEERLAPLVLGLEDTVCEEKNALDLPERDAAGRELRARNQS